MFSELGNDPERPPERQRSYREYGTAFHVYDWLRNFGDEPEPVKCEGTTLWMSLCGYIPYGVFDKPCHMPATIYDAGHWYCHIHASPPALFGQTVEGEMHHTMNGPEWAKLVALEVRP